jgi:hypothetical protein
VLVGQPFDIVKVNGLCCFVLRFAWIVDVTPRSRVQVRLQSSDVYSGAVNCATRIAKDEGLLAFYKGWTLPSQLEQKRAG